MTDRGVAPLVGVALLVLLSVALAAVVAGGLAAVDADDPPPAATLEVDADADADRIGVTHGGGDALDPDAVSLRVEIDGENLDRQPPVPFFSVRGFDPGPNGPFNSGWHGDWVAGETASLRVAGTNDPDGIDEGETVRVVVKVDGRVLADQRAVAQ
ncbi:type IV pilin [Natronoarchaeum mannanilyticum]|uniref:type IV pilin n=1 Tax=Natronoarchaeum mannanilyticum TaxID=926360 RepID=UPI0031D23F43